MTTYTGAADVIPGDLDGLDLAASTITKAADSAAELSTDLSTTVGATADFWASPSGTAYRVSAQRHVGTLGMLVGPLDTAAQAFGTLSRELRGARSTVDRALAGAVALGMGPADLVGDPWAVVGFLAGNPHHASPVAGLLSDIVAARIAAGSAHTAFVESLAGVRDGLAGADERLLGSRRGPDERGGRRIDEDDRRGRNPGGDGSGDHFDNDWAGRAILERYLRGGDDWTINDDPDWSRYMRDNGVLRDQLRTPVDEQAQRALDNYRVTGSERDEFRQQFHADIQTGEGIVGYQYLHGTEQNLACSDQARSGRQRPGDQRFRLSPRLVEKDMRTRIVPIAVAVAVAVLAGCAALSGCNRNADERFVRPGQPRTSPSGEFVARADLGPEQNGVQTWIVVITNRAGREVFHDTETYSSRHGVGITWLTGVDQLWVLSADIGTSSVQQDPNGTWSKRYPRSGHFDKDVPPEIRQLSGR